MSKKPPYWGWSNRARNCQLADDYEQETEEHKEKLHPFHSLNPNVRGDCKCGGKYILRQNHRSKEYFYGCSNFPKCKIIREILLEWDYLLEKEAEGKLSGGKILNIDRQHKEYLLEKNKRNQKNEVERKMDNSRTAADLEREDNIGDEIIDQDDLPLI